jgi:hypothetical protein
VLSVKLICPLISYSWFIFHLSKNIREGVTNNTLLYLSSLSLCLIHLIGFPQFKEKENTPNANGMGAWRVTQMYPWFVLPYPLHTS